MSARLPERPFHGPSAAGSSSRRILLISWHFPPSNATGALRWQRLALHAERRRWGLDVITLHPDAVERTEWERMQELPAGTRVYGIRPRTPRLESVVDALSHLKDTTVRIDRSAGPDGAEAVSAPGSGSPGATTPETGLVPRPEVRWSLGRPAGWKRTLNAWTEHRRGAPWARDVASLARRIVTPATHDLIVSCGPPHAAHTAARRVSRDAGLPLVLDLRDPWSLVRAVHAHEASPLAYRLRFRAERAAVARAEIVVSNTEAHTIAIRAAHPEARARFVTVRNGCDEDDSVESTRRDRFVIAYAGGIYIDRDPRSLFAAAGRLVRARGLEPDEFTVEFMGDVESFGGVSVRRLAEEAGLDRHVRLHPPAPRSQALDFLATASMLVSLPQSATLAIPSKIYEYMQFQAWILALAARGSATELLLRGSLVDVVEPEDVEGIADALGHRLDQFRRREAPPRIANDLRFSRRREAERFFDLLETWLGPPRKGVGPISAETPDSVSSAHGS